MAASIEKIALSKETEEKELAEIGILFFKNNFKIHFNVKKWRSQ